MSDQTKEPSLTINAIGTGTTHSQLQKVQKALRAFGVIAVTMGAAGTQQAHAGPLKDIEKMFEHNTPAHSGTPILWDINRTQNKEPSTTKTYDIKSNINTGPVIQARIKNVKEANMHIRDNTGQLVKPENVHLSALAPEPAVQLVKPAEVKAAKIQKDQGMEF